MKKIILQLALVFFISTLIVFFAGDFASSQSSSDAIAIRVMPNPEHYTIERWYQEQNFQGSPQSLIVDGYQAIRDGRTVYVNAANVNTSTSQIYTNIYLISYTQESEDATIDILGQIVSHWKFNHNIINTGKCSISTMYCEEDDDCPGNYVCGNDSNDWQEGKCVIEDSASDLSNTKTCLTDQDCPNNLYCTSLKSRVIRDVRRLGQLTDVDYLLDLYNQQNNKYPTLNSGTYIPQMSISTWPSWQSELSRKLEAPSNVIDPINTLGYCGGDYASETCWDSDSQSFYDANVQDGVNLPDNSLVYVYTTDVNGTDYDICANMESGYDVAEGSVSNYDCDFNIGYFGSTTNDAPILVDFNLEGSSSESFSGMIRIEDPEGNPLTWQLDTSLSSWSSWSSPPVLQSTDNPNQKRIFAQITGNNGTYPIRIIVTDSAGNVTEKQLDIVISNVGPQIQAEDINYVIEENSPLDYKAYIYSNNLPSSADQLSSNLTISYSGFPSGFNSQSFSTSQSSLGHGLSKDIIKVADNRFELNITGILGDTTGNGSINENLGLEDPEPEQINFTLTVQDTNGKTSTEDFTFNIIFDKPILALDCQESIRAGKDYSCQLVVYSSTENYSLFYNNLPYGLNGNNSGLISGTANPSGVHNISVTARNEYGGTSTSGYTLDINSYCGDGNKQDLNDELAGGPNGDGREQCDVLDNVALTPASSSVDKQYDCTTDTIAQHDEPVQAGTCTFDGGYCGDTVLQKTVNGRNLEECDFGADITDCCVTCAWVDDYQETNLTFISGESEASLDKDDVVYVDFPQVRDFDPTSGFMDAEVIATDLQTTAIVYVTDTSGSMSGSIGNVQDGLIGASGDGGALGLLRQNAGNIAVGLVEFNSGIEDIDLGSIHSDAHYNKLVDTVSSYSADASTYTKDAIDSAVELLSYYDADNKFIVLLSDGSPNPSSTQDPTNSATIAKSAGIDIYTITYKDNTITYDMCMWSSDSDSVCSSGTNYVYSYQADNVDTVYINITNEIVTGPQGTLVITINGIAYNFTIEDLINDNIMEDLSVSFEAVSCDPYTAVCFPDKVPIEVDFEGEGEIRLYNLRLDVAEPCGN